MAEADEPGGYGKPPKASQFKKGQSGNPGGKRKRPLSLGERVTRALNRRVAIKEPGPTIEKMEVVGDLLARRLVQAAFNDPKLARLVWDRESAEIDRAERRAAKAEADALRARDEPSELEEFLKDHGIMTTLILEEDDKRPHSWIVQKDSKEWAEGMPFDPYGGAGPPERKK